MPPHGIPTIVKPQPEREGNPTQNIPAQVADNDVTPGESPYSTSLTYTDRASKACYIAAKYSSILQASVLDVGCDSAPLRRLVARPDLYRGVDLGPPADVVLNLDRDNLPFESESFFTVVCTDVLEHLERCHAVFDELCRVASHYVLVSLPNPLATLVKDIHEGGLGKIKYYGLPVDPPADRHRWFFGFEEAAAFLTTRGARQGFTVEQLDSEGRLSLYWRTGREQRDVLASPNIQAGTTWCVLRRTASTSSQLSSSARS